MQLFCAHTFIIKEMLSTKNIFIIQKQSKTKLAKDFLHKALKLPITRDIHLKISVLIIEPRRCKALTGVPLQDK